MRYKILEINSFIYATRLDVDSNIVFILTAKHDSC